MEIDEMNIPEEAPDDVVQFAKHLEENLDPDDQYECRVTITIAKEFKAFGVVEMEAERLGENNEYGVEVVVHPVESVEKANTLGEKVGILADQFFEGSQTMAAEAGDLDDAYHNGVYPKYDE